MLPPLLGAAAPAPPLTAAPAAPLLGAAAPAPPLAAAAFVPPLGAAAAPALLDVLRAAGGREPGAPGPDAVAGEPASAVPFAPPKPAVASTVGDVLEGDAGSASAPHAPQITNIARTRQLRACWPILRIASMLLPAPRSHSPGMGRRRRLNGRNEGYIHSDVCDVQPRNAGEARIMRWGRDAATLYFSRAIPTIAS